MKLINIILAIVFVTFAALQYNDPDPYIWIFFYGVSALLCIGVGLGKTFRLGNITLILFSVIWMVLLVPQIVDCILGEIPPPDSTVAVGKVELLREFFGLSLVIFVMLFHLRIGKATDKIHERKKSLEHVDH